MDGHLLIVPQQGCLRVTTELGRLRAPPGHVVVIPRNVLFSVALEEGPARGAGPAVSIDLDSASQERIEAVSSSR